MRRALVTALAACAEKRFRVKTRRFLAGLSCDELQFLAEFLGASILEWDCHRPTSQSLLVEQLAEFQKVRYASGEGVAADQDHKMILLVEYLGLSGLHQGPMPIRAWKS
ncbi:MAG: hypothetical protein JOZ22_01220 [Acidobacteriia bacterium]|nr:hypothetical protein [Terriglobia bacterium]MBV9743277.1 hypothetical protein [Terriglobia bacterium]